MNAIPETAYHHFHSRCALEHQTGYPLLGLRPGVRLPALAVVPEANHAAVCVAVRVAVLPGAHRFDSRDQPIAK